MNKLMGWLVTILILCGIGYLIYHVFFDCSGINSMFDRSVTIEKYDYVKFNKRILTKVMKLDDKNCDGDFCTDENIAKILVMDDRHISYIKLSKSESRIELDKLNCVVILEDITDKDVTIRVKDLEKKNETI